MALAIFSKIGVRHVQVGLLFVLLLLSNALRVNMSIGIVAITDQTTTDVQVFDWGESIRSVILSSFFWGYAVTQIPAGALSKRFGPKVILGWSFFVASILTVLTYPLALWGNWQLTTASRVIQGLAQGPIYPCSHVLLSKWAPIEERSRMSAIVYSGES